MIDGLVGRNRRHRIDVAHFWKPIPSQEIGYAIKFSVASRFCEYDLRKGVDIEPRGGIHCTVLYEIVPLLDIEAYHSLLLSIRG